MLSFCHQTAHIGMEVDLNFYLNIYQKKNFNSFWWTKDKNIKEYLKKKIKLFIIF